MQSQLRFAERLYQALLQLYPPDFRAACGTQMRLTFRDACREAYRRSGPGGLLALWLATLLDLFKSVLAAWARQGEVSMSKKRLVMLAGPLTILAGVMWLVAFLADFFIMTGLANVELFWDEFWFFTFYLSFIPLFLALIGIRSRFQQTAGRLGRLGLALAIAGSAGMIVAALARIGLGGVAPEVIRYGPWLNDATTVFSLGFMIGYCLFGAAALKNKLLPRWNLLPLLAGSTIIYMFIMTVLDIPGSHPMQSLPFFITGICWILMGNALMVDVSREPQSTAGL